jgi:presenilin-like A22 family membrane protease
MPVAATVFLLSLYALTGGLVIAASRWASGLKALPGPQIGSVWEALFIGVATVGFALFAMRRIRVRVFWELLFTAALFFGAWLLFLLVLPFAWATAAALGIMALPFAIPRVVIHNVFMILGAAGAAMSFAFQFAPTGLVALLVGLAVYDHFVTGPKGLLVEFVKQLIRWRLIPGLIVPPHLRGFWHETNAPPEPHALILGVGDLVVPLMLVSRAAMSHTLAAVVVLLGAVFGLAALLARDDGRPRAALPWLAVGTLLAFVLVIGLGYVV